MGIEYNFIQTSNIQNVTIRIYKHNIPPLLDKKDFKRNVDSTDTVTDIEKENRERDLGNKSRE